MGKVNVAAPFVIVDMTGEVRVLLVKVSVVALPTRVSVAAGNVRVPEAAAEACNTVEPLDEPVCVAPLPIVGEVKVLFVNVSVVALPTKVSVEVGKVKVPVFEIEEIIGVVRVLFVNVSVVALPTRVSVEVGRVNVPELTMVAITGEVKVLFVNVSVVALPTKVSVASGNVIVRSAVGSPALRVVSKASAVVPSKTIDWEKANSSPVC